MDEKNSKNNGRILRKGSSMHLNEVMDRYLDGSEFYQHRKLGSIYRKFFKEPVRILGNNLPKLSKLICSE